jgi:hypothetical protein
MGSRGTPKLLVHVELVELLDRVPIELQFLGHYLYGGIVTAGAHKESESLCVVRQLRQPIEAFGPDGTTTPAVHTPNIHGEINALVAAREIADQTRPLIVKNAMHLSALATDCFFRRWCRGRMMAAESPGYWRTEAAGTNPGNR